MAKMKLSPGGKFTFMLLALLVLGIGLSYGNSLGIGFLFDDCYGIANNPAIRSLRNIPRFFSDPLTMTTARENVDVRPVLVTTYAINYAISGNAPWSFHVLNLILHLIASLMVFFIVRDSLWWPAVERGADGEARIPAAAAALFFALAPLNSQTMNYISARSALLCTLLYLAAFLALLRRRRLVGLILHALALLPKAIAITLPAVYVIYDFLYRDRMRYPTLKTYICDWKRMVAPVAPPALLSLVYLAGRTLLLPPGADAVRHEAWVTPGVWFMSQWSALVYYVRLFLWPDALSIDHDFPYTTSLLSARPWFALSPLLAWLAVAGHASRRFPQVTFATLWFFITLAPESSFAALSEVVNEHRPYIASSLGLSVLLAWALYRATRLSRTRAPTTFAAVCLVLCVPAVSFNAYRSWQWNDALRLWEDAVRKGPNNGRAWTNAGQIYMSRGQLAEARRYLERAREVNPQYPYLYTNLSALEALEGRPAEALRDAQEAVRLRPDLSLAHLYLGRALANLRRMNEAASSYRQALALDPNNSEARAGLANSDVAREEALQDDMMKTGLDLLYVKRDSNAAAMQFQRILQRNPSHYGATFQLATALDRAGKAAEARPLWEKILKMAEADADSKTEATARARLQKHR